MTQISILNPQENQIYLSCLELGTDTIQNIAKKSGIPRSSCYLIIEELKNKGLISQSKIDKKTLFTAENPSKIKQLISAKKTKLDIQLEEVENQLPQLQALYNSKQNKPLISYYQGFEGIKTILEKSLQAKEILVLCTGYSELMDQKTGNYLDNIYFPKCDELNIKTKEIIGYGPDAQDYVDKYQNSNHQIRLLKKVLSQPHIDKLIFDDSVLMIDYQNLNGTVIEHAGIASFEKALFEKLWEATT